MAHQEITSNISFAAQFRTLTSKQVTKASFPGLSKQRYRKYDNDSLNMLR